MGSDTLKYMSSTCNVVVGQVWKGSSVWVVESEASTGDAKLSYLECVSR